MRKRFLAAGAAAMACGMAGTAAAQQRANAPGQPLAGSYQLPEASPHKSPKHSRKTGCSQTS